MNYVIRKAKEHTGGCVASLPLCNSGIKQQLRVTAQCLGDVRAYNIVEANITTVRWVTRKGPCHWGGVRPCFMQVRPCPKTRRLVSGLLCPFIRPDETTLV